MKKILLLTIVLSLHFRGKLIAQSETFSFTLTGTISPKITASKVYLVYQYEGQKFIDSASVIDGRFRLNNTAPFIVLATLVMDHQAVGLKGLLKAPVDKVDALKFYLQPGSITLNLKDSISTAVFIDSKVNQDYARLKKLLGINEEHKLYYLSAQMQELRAPAAGKAYVTYYDSLKKARRPLLREFILENPKSYIALTALMDYGGDFADTADLRPLFKKIDTGLRNNFLGKKINMMLNNKVEVGAIAPDFTQFDTHSRPVKLSSFRGKYVLINFWASWCLPCREDNPQWVKVYDQLKDKNFTILGISLDGQDTKAGWLKAIEDDGLTWPQVSDLKHWDNTVAELYGVRAIPQNVLIDTQGKVAGRNLEPDEVLALVKRMTEGK
ncbi:MAG: redoxin domain-containing protein [Mucilaginibacter sp.]